MEAGRYKLVNTANTPLDYEPLNFGSTQNQLRNDQAISLIYLPEQTSPAQVS